MNDMPRTDNLHDLYDALERDARRDVVRFAVGVLVGLCIAAAAFLLGTAAS